jgi:hypothetical protein
VERTRPVFEGARLSAAASPPPDCHEPTTGRNPATIPHPATTARR